MTGYSYTSLLQQEMRRVRRLGWSGLVLAGLLLGLAWGGVASVQWLLQAGLLWWLVMHETGRRLHLNRAPASGFTYPTLGWANRVTILRGGLIAATGGFLFQPWPMSWLSWLPGLLYMVSAIIDRVDGYIARRTGQTSELGLELDTRLDALGLAVAPLLAVWYGQVHWSYLLVSLAYYLFQWGIRRRWRRGLPVQPLPPTLSRRSLAGFQMGFVAVALLPVFRPPATTVAGLAFMIPLLTGFVIDWLIVSGRLPARPTGLARRARRLGRALLLPGLRLFVFGMLSVSLYQGGLLVPAGEVPSHLAAAMLGYGSLLAGVMALLGITGRVAALALIGLLGAWSQIGSPGPAGHVLLFAAVWLLLFGSGRFSLWSPDDDWVNRYDGGP